MAWIAGMLAVAVLTIGAMWGYGRYRARPRVVRGRIGGAESRS